MDIPTTLLKLRDDNDSPAFYVITAINSWFSREVIGAILDEINKRFLTNFFYLCHPI